MTTKASKPRHKTFPSRNAVLFPPSLFPSLRG